MQNRIIGRKHEIQILEELYASVKAENVLQEN